MKYIPRLVDSEIDRKLLVNGAMLVRGAKGCGKTETARHHAKSEITIDDSVRITNAMQTEPTVLLSGETPRLIDEWQEQLSLWNTVRHEVDRRQQPGQFILTGSANPPDDAKLHSGVGRFSVIHMRTMSSQERGWSDTAVSLNDLFNDRSLSGNSDVSAREIADRLLIGGFPGIKTDDVSLASDYLSDYLELLCEVDLSRASGVKRDPQKVRRLLQSLARNISTEATNVTMQRDVGNMSIDTVAEYLSALERVMITDDLPSWYTHIRSGARLRKSSKRHLVDQSLAAAALGLTPQTLLADMEYMGLLFESMVIHDLRIYAEHFGGKLYHYRDSNGVEADAVMELKDGRWAAFEIKLGFGGVDAGARSLLTFNDTIAHDKAGHALALTVITGSGFAHRRSDSVSVVPIWCLGV